MLHLKRFTYDSATGKRNKLSKPVDITPTLSMGKVCAGPDRLVADIIQLSGAAEQCGIAAVTLCGCPTAFCTSKDTVLPSVLPSAAGASLSEGVANEEGDDFKSRRRLDFQETRPSANPVTTKSPPKAAPSLTAREKEQLLVEQAIAQSLMDSVPPCSAAGSEVQGMTEEEQLEWALAESEKLASEKTAEWQVRENLDESSQEATEVPLHNSATDPVRCSVVDSDETTPCAAAAPTTGPKGAYLLMSIIQHSGDAAVRGKRTVGNGRALF